MQQLGIGLIAALALGLLVWAFMALSSPGPQPNVGAESSLDGRQATVDIANSRNSGNDADPGTMRVDGREILMGRLAGKYFSAAELSRLGFEGRDVAQTKYWSDLQLNFLLSGGPSPDTISSVDEPHFTSTAEADEWLADEEFVAGIEFDGMARAYPIAILNWHEIINDDFNGITVVTTYCPLCNSSVSFVAPVIDGQVAAFGTSGRLYLSDLVMYDRVTGTFWSQLEGAPIVGPLVGVMDGLDRVPVDMVPYGLWKEKHPDTRVLARPQAGDRLGNQVDARTSLTGFVRNYDVDPYSRYRVSNPGMGEKTSFGIPINDDRLKAKDDVIGVIVGGRAKAYGLAALQAQRLLNDEVGGVPIVVVVLPTGGVRVFARNVPGVGELTFTRTADGLVDDQGNAWGFEGEAALGGLADQRLEEIVGTLSFWFAWVTFNPQTELFYETED